MICSDKDEGKHNTTQKTKKMTNNQMSRTVSSSYILGDTRHIADNVYQLLAHGRWFSPGTSASSTTKTGRYGIAEILLKVALGTINQ
jgi:hypothetical protein